MVSRQKNPQVKFLKDNLSTDIINWAEEQAKVSPRHPFFTRKQSKFYNFVTFMLWKYLEQKIGRDILDRLDEPLLGNPPAAKLNGKLISQDLAHSLLEFQSISEDVGDFKNIRNVLELGGGYGRTAYVILSLHRHIKYIMVDIPPALYIAQRYLSQVFPDKTIFTFRNFKNFSDIADDFYKSDIAFLMPTQLKNLPKKTIDLFLAIDCLHEMRVEQIDAYFNSIDELAKQFYFSCWKKAIIPYEDTSITEKTYPVRPHWKKVFWRDRRVQVDFFEAFYSL